MSFITKRERVFNEYDVFDLPARNEGKLKAYASCTDTRAWSHFCTDKSEHLVEVIKRNNDVCRPKYVPTNVIVDTLMVAKNAEIARLRQKIETFEQMLAAYDQLELTSAQKGEIANAHATIKAANKELDELYLDLDLSTFTEGSEGFETGKSRGDESIQEQKVDSKAVQISPPRLCEVATHVKDERIDKMEDDIITKDAKLNALKNTLAVMENDICEPYCIYAHIYTALEKIFGILCQNDKYKKYLNLLTSGKDTRCIDIKGKILFKLKVLEKFCCALIAPCCQDLEDFGSRKGQVACYRTEVSQAEYSNEKQDVDGMPQNEDDKRAKLVADIIQNEEINEILSKESRVNKPEHDNVDIMDNDCIIETENLRRIKSLQINYDDLMTCHESLKHEKICLEVRCRKYEDLELEYESLKNKIREYNSVWNEKEHYRKRSVNLDELKEQYLLLKDETCSIETQLKAEKEINHIKCKTIEDLRNENMLLEKKLNEATMCFEKEKNAFMCKLKEADCRIMCQGQQVKSLSMQIDRILEQDEQKAHLQGGERSSMALINEIKSLNEQIKNLKDALLCNEEEKQELQDQYQHQLALINSLKMEIDELRGTNENTLNQNEKLQNYAEMLSQELIDKSKAVENLMAMNKSKSQEISQLLHEIDINKNENNSLHQQLHEQRNSFEHSIASLQNERKEALSSLHLVRQESQELLEKVKNYDDVVHENADVAKSLESQLEENEQLKQTLEETMKDYLHLKTDLRNSEKHNSILLEELQNLREINEYALNENSQQKRSLELTQKESMELKDKLMMLNELKQQLQLLQNSHEMLHNEKNRLENQLMEKSRDLENALNCIEISKRDSDTLIKQVQQSEIVKNELLEITDAYNNLLDANNTVQIELLQKNDTIEKLMKSLDELSKQYENLQQHCKENENINNELLTMKKVCEVLMTEKNILQKDFDKQTLELNKLQSAFENKIEDNKKLLSQIESIEMIHATSKHKIKHLEDERSITRATLDLIKKESHELMHNAKNYNLLQTEYEKLKEAHDAMKLEKERLQNKLEMQIADLERIERENYELNNQTRQILSHNEDLENSLIHSRTELLKKSSSELPIQDIMTEIEGMKQEKLNNQKTIRKLRDKLDESETIILNLTDDIVARDHKISTLDNHINELEDEVRRLHSNLADVIETGEELKDFGLQSYESLRNMDAHHSKATHNMKMELAKLKHEKTDLEERLSITRVRSDDYIRDNNKYISQVIHLQNEREIIVTDIKQLELKSVGDSALMPDNCAIEDILESLDRIRKYLDAKISKTSLLEQTLSKMENSSQLLLCKADEAKKIVEKEKQKIINEKEEAIKDRQNMERQLLDIKNNLENQISHDKTVIKDLEGTILNQNLIIDKTIQSTQEYVSKLKDDLQTLENLYKNSITTIDDLERKLQNKTDDVNKYSNSIKQIRDNFEEKSREVDLLQKELDSLKNKSRRDIGVSVNSTNSHFNIGTQTMLLPHYHHNVGIQVDLEHLYNANKENSNMPLNEKMTETSEKLSKDHLDNIRPIELPKHQRPHTFSEVQVLSASVQPSYLAIRTTYVNYKMKHLSQGRLEHCSVSCGSDRELNVRRNEMVDFPTQNIDNKLPKVVNTNLIDIYNRPSINTNSSKGHVESENVINSKLATSSQGKSNKFPMGRYETDSNIINKYDNKTYDESSSEKLPDKELFIVYDDNGNSHEKNRNSNDTWSVKQESEVRMTNSTELERQKNDFKNEKTWFEQDSFIYIVDEEDDSIKPKLTIQVPQVGTKRSSAMTISDGDKKSISFAYSSRRLSDSIAKLEGDLNEINFRNRSPSLPTLSIDDDQFLITYDLPSYKLNQHEDRANVMETDCEIIEKQHLYNSAKKKRLGHHKTESYHDLSRVGADLQILKTERKTDEDRIEHKTGNFGLDYILGMVTVNEQKDPINIRKIKSDVKLNAQDFKVENEKEINYINKNGDDSPMKNYVERSIMVKMEMEKEEYEKKIAFLTKALENIEKDYKKKIEVIKVQYDMNIKSIINEHNHGVKSIQGLHEETLQDILKIHENEVENLRTMSIEAMRKVEKLEKENKVLKTKCQDSSTTGLDEKPIKIIAETKKPKRNRVDSKTLTTTTVEAFNVRPKRRSQGPCSCTLDVDVSDTIRNIFEQVDVEQRKMAEKSYMKFIANKIIAGNIETLDAQELSFLHFKVCRMWKSRLTKEEALQKRINLLETELLTKQRNTQQHIADLDRKVAEERRRLQEVRDAMCRSPTQSRSCSPCVDMLEPPPVPPPTAAAEKDYQSVNDDIEVDNRRSAGDIATGAPSLAIRGRRVRGENRTVLANLDGQGRREKKLYNDEPPTRLRRAHDRQAQRFTKK